MLSFSQPLRSRNLPPRKAPPANRCRRLGTRVSRQPLQAPRSMLRAKRCRPRRNLEKTPDRARLISPRVSRQRRVPQRPGSSHSTVKKARHPHRCRAFLRNGPGTSDMFTDCPLMSAVFIATSLLSSSSEKTASFIRQSPTECEPRTPPREGRKRPGQPHQRTWVNDRQRRIHSPATQSHPGWRLDMEYFCS